jgi:TonB family protein
MDESEKKRKRTALLITIGFHVLITILFLLFGLKQPVPLPEEQGASVEFGWDADASGALVAGSDIAPTPSENTPIPDAQPEETPDEEVATDEESDIAIPPKKEEPKPKTEKPKEPTTPKDPVKPKEETKPKEDTKPKEEPKPQINQALSDALGQIGKGGGTKGDGKGEGTQGNPQGTTGTGSLGAGNGSWELSGRSMMPGYGTKISTTDEEGTVVLNITVDRNGKVTNATPNLKESTTTSQKLINLAIKDAINNFRFNTDANASIEQRGKIRYVFKLQ